MRVRVAVRYFRRFISSRNLDDHELALVVKTQCSLDKPALGRPNPVPGDLDFHEPDLIRLPPGEHIEEAAQLSPSLAAISGNSSLSASATARSAAKLSLPPSRESYIR
jgi:hypothetical protein